MALTICAGCGNPPTPSGVAITNVSVIDASNGVRENHTVVFDGDEIVSVGPAAETAGADVVIDGSGKFLIPGLWDMHVHLTYDDALTSSMPRSFLYYGVTSVRDTGGLLHELKPVVEAMRAPGAVSPRVYFSGPLLDGKHVVYDGVSRPKIGIANPTVEKARQNVAELKKQGVDFIKIYELVSPDVHDALVEAAEEAGLPIASHVPLSLRASEAGPRVDSMEHLRNVELDCAGNASQLLEARRRLLSSSEVGSGWELRSSILGSQRRPAIAMHHEQSCLEVVAALRSTIQVPTARLLTVRQYPPNRRDEWKAAFARLPVAVRDDWLGMLASLQGTSEPRDTRFEDWAMEMIARMHALGVPIGAGTDTPIGFAIPGYSLLNELDLLVRAGLSPLEALRSATIRPAEFFGLEGEMGSIGPGMKADMVLLLANPLHDINNVRRIDSVVSKGVVHPRAELEQAQAVGSPAS
ncbi:MAG: amidohydrolase family protein [bacterium]|nr:amidohydrolase family protein [bacterium]